MKQYDAMGVYKKGHYHRLNRSNDVFSWNMQAGACLHPIKNIGSLFHAHYISVFPSCKKKNFFFSKATHLTPLKQNISL